MIRRLLSALVILAWTASLALAATTTFPSYWKSINARDYGAVCDGSHDDTVAIQAAIDASYAAGIQTTYLPAGACKTSTSLFLDPPGNLRGSAPAWASGTTYSTGAVVTYAGVPWASVGSGNVGNAPSVTSAYWVQTTATPSIFNQSMALVGDQGIGNNNGFGTTLYTTFNNATAVWVGTGNGMAVRGIQVIGPSGTYRGLQSLKGVGIGIAGGNGGASRTLIENTFVANFYAAYETGANNVTELSDSNSFRKVAWDNAAYGIRISNFNNDINDVIEPEGGATVEISSLQSRSVNVFGGNLSSSGLSGAFGLSAVSALSEFNNGATNIYTFTATLASPDQYVGTLYNAYTIKTADFGVVPLVMTAWNSGTGVGTFQIFTNWGAFYFNSANALSVSALQAEVQAATKIYATEQVTVFEGKAFNVLGTHIENPSACTKFIHDTSTFNGDDVAEYSGLFFNYDPGLSGYGPSNSPTDAQLALYYCAQSFPFIHVETVSAPLKISNSHFGQANWTDPVVIDIESSTNSRIYFENLNYSLFSPTVRIATFGGNMTGGYQDPYTAGIGGGNWDVSPFLSRSGPLNQGQEQLFYSYYLSHVPFVGWHAAPWVAPRLASYWLGVVTGTLPAIGQYPPLDGNTIYNLVDYNSGTLAHLWARSAHQFYSYGQNLTAASGNGQISGLAWSYKGQSFVVNLDASSIQWMFPGLEILLNNGGGNVAYEVTGVYPGLGYITVMQTCDYCDGSGSVLAGTSGTTYTGTTIGQNAFAFTQY